MRSGRWGSRIVGLFVVLYVFCFLLAHSPKILDYYRVSDDARQQIYPLHLAQDKELFQDDLLTTYFLSHTPPFYYWAHYPIAMMVDPILISKIAQFTLLAVVLIFLYFTGKLLSGPFLGWSLVFVTIHSPLLAAMTDGGLPRGWAVPGLVVFSWAVLARRPRVALVAVVVSGLFYPPVFLVLGPSYALWTLWRRSWSVWDAAALVVLGIGFWPIVFRSDEIGTIVTYTQAASMPEWQLGSRFPFVPTPPLSSLVARNFVVAYLPPELYSEWAAWLLLASALAGLLIQSPRREVPASDRSRLEVAAAFGLPLAFSLLMFEISRLVAFRLHIPDRNVKYTLPVLGAVLLTLVLFRVCSFGASKMPPRYVLLRWKGWPAILAVTLAFALGGSGFTGNLNLWADQGWASRLFEFVETLPGDSLLAGPPVVMDSIPLFAKRKVFVSDEAVQPLYVRYYAEISARVRATYGAYYSSDVGTVEEFVETRGVDYMVVQIDDFTHRLHRSRYYWEPYNSYVASLIGSRPASDFVFAQAPEQSIVYDDGYFRIVHLPALIEELRRHHRESSHFVSEVR
jgi:hypothetical protein